MAKIKPPKLERLVGMEVYKSETPGIGGKLKLAPEDFIVEEITPGGQILEVCGFKEHVTGYVPENETEIYGEYTHFVLKKCNWDTMRAIKEISRRLGISRGRLSFAGTKDKRALTVQRVSVRNVPIENLTKIRIKDIILGGFEYADDRVHLGDLRGNMFTITIRNIIRDINSDSNSCKDLNGCEQRGCELNDCDLSDRILNDQIDSISDELKTGIPNFFGVQRFGTIRPITHLVGKEILNGNFQEAVMIYLARDFEGEGDEVRNARISLSETGDIKKALVEFPKHLGYESAMLNHLVNRPTDYTGAIGKLPEKLRSMFIHAYQSFVFNRALSEYITQDIVVEKLPLPGYSTGIDEITLGILETEDMQLSDFRIKSLPELSSKGEYRNCFINPQNFRAIIDGISASDLKATFRFSLPKGSYATVVLREFMKNAYY